MKLCSEDKCSSCMACYNICHSDAIRISENAYGATRPYIIEKKCIKCRLCQRVCPELNHPELRYPLKCYALYAKSSRDRLTCASGGAATSFSRYVIANGGYVFGATSVGGYPHYIQVDAEKNLELLKGSKYVYCNPERVYNEVKAKLKSGKLCLFIGTPCNVGGLYNFLQRKYENLITIDLICHGTPPFSYLKEHIQANVGDYNQVGNFTFRGQNDFFLTVFDKQGRVLYKRNQYEDEYFMSFMQGFLFRQACYTCQYAQSKRVADITLGDFWGLGRGGLGEVEGKVSVSLLNNEKAIYFFNQAKDLVYYEEREIQEAINGNEQLRCPSVKSQSRAVFENFYADSHSVLKALQKMGIMKQSKRNRIRRHVMYVPKLLKHLLKKVGRSNC